MDYYEIKNHSPAIIYNLHDAINCFRIQIEILHIKTVFSDSTFLYIGGMSHCKKSFCIFLLLFFPAALFSQSSFRNYYKPLDTSNGENWDKVIQTGDSGYAVLLNSVDSGRSNFILMKTDPSGNIQWSANYHLNTTTVHPLASSFLQLPDSSFLVAGRGDSANIYCWHISSGGLLLYVNKYHADLAHTIFGVHKDNPDIAILSDGNILFGASVTATIQGLVGGVCNWILKTDVQGNIIWSQFFRRDSLHSSPNFRGITSSVHGGFYGFDNFIAIDTTANISSDIFRGDNNGNILWLKQLGGSFQASCISVTSDNNLLIGGSFETIIKMDSIGTILWSKVLSVNGGPVNLVEQRDGTYLLVRSTSSVRAVVLDTSGNPLGQATSIQPLLSAGYMNYAEPTFNGGFVGISEKDTTGFILIKTDSLLNPGCNIYHTFENMTSATVIDSNGFYQEPAAVTVMDVTAAAYLTPANFAVIDACLNNSTSQEEENPDFLIAPNPATNSITISGLRKPISQIEIFNSVGEKVFNEKIEEETTTWTIPIKLPPGFYVVTVSDSKSYSMSKLIIQ